MRPPLSARTSSSRHRIDTRYIAGWHRKKVPGGVGALDLISRGGATGPRSGVVGASRPRGPVSARSAVTDPYRAAYFGGVLGKPGLSACYGRANLE